MGMCMGPANPPADGTCDAPYWQHARRPHQWMLRDRQRIHKTLWQTRPPTEHPDTALHVPELHDKPAVQLTGLPVVEGPAVNGAASKDGRKLWPVLACGVVVVSHG